MSEDGAAEGLRLNKALAGVCARRKADALIFAGRVAVNGEIETSPGRRVFPGDEVRLDGRPVETAQKPVCLMLNKPAGVVSTARDPQGRPTVLDLAPPPWNRLRLYPVGRLDYFSEGLLLLTNCGALAQKLAHPGGARIKRYETLIRRDAPEEALAAMRAGMTLEDGTRLAPVAASKRKAGANTLLTLDLTQGVNRQIRRMCAMLGLTVLRLRRIAQGDLRLGSLAPGKTRLLTDEEIARLL